MEQLFFVLILIGAIVLYATRALPYEATSTLVLGLLVVTRILTVEEALSGFSSPATVTIAAMFVLSAGLIRTGALEVVVLLLRRGAGDSVPRLVLLLAITVGVSSAFLNNTPVVVMMIPVVLAIGRHVDLSSSKLLMPVSFFAILGGTCTLLGTSTNLLVDQLYRSAGGPGFGIFDFAPLGVCLFFIGTLYIVLFDDKLLPSRTPLSAMLPEDRGATFVTELLVHRKTPIVGELLRDVIPPGEKGVRLLEIVRGEEVMFASNALDERVQPEDSLIVEGPPAGVAEFIDRHELRVASVVEDEKRVEVHSMDLSIAEAVVLPDSRFVGRRVSRLGLNRLYGVKVMAIQRHGLQHRYHIRGLRLKGGDVLLVQADRRGLDALRETGSVLVVEGVDRLLVQKAKAPIALGVLGGVIALTMLNVAPLAILAVIGAGLLIATRCLRATEAIASLDPPVLFLIAGSIPLGIALEKTGLARLMVDGTLATLGDLGPRFVLSGIYLLTGVLSAFLSNNATAVLMTPLALGVAASLAVDPRPFLMAVAFGASASFATPIGYQTNTIVMGPGGYTFGDFFRFGLPLNVLLWVAATILIPFLYPFG